MLFIKAGLDQEQGLPLELHITGFNPPKLLKQRVNLRNVTTQGQADELLCACNRLHQPAKARDFQHQILGLPMGKFTKAKVQILPFVFQDVASELFKAHQLLVAVLLFLFQ
ncbi:hypothetical protein SDC9_115912 [bioreactor metagenome]|uniref:Uncharacterized protein n=1 Tax=bioreactor metagenome TaxID=1076179 RepID=A0A645BUQ2_9ZZZZ